MAFIYFLTVIGILAVIGTVWNLVAIHKEDRDTNVVSSVP